MCNWGPEPQSSSGSARSTRDPPHPETIEACVQELDQFMEDHPWDVEDPSTLPLMK